MDLVRLKTMDKEKPRCLKCRLILKPGHICKPKCDSCHDKFNPKQLKEYPDANGQYCKECYKLHLQCHICKRLFLGHWAITGHPSHGQDAIPYEIESEYK